MTHLLGYARLSTTDQQPQLQVDAFKRAGCYECLSKPPAAPAATAPVLTPGGAEQATRTPRQLRAHNGYNPRPQLDLTGSGRGHTTAADPYSCRSGAVLWWCWLVAPTGFEPALPP
jgi:hypothetical protein